MTSKKDHDASPLLAAAEAFDAELERFGHLTESARKGALGSQKALNSCVRVDTIITGQKPYQSAMFCSDPAVVEKAAAANAKLDAAAQKAKAKAAKKKSHSA